MIVLAYSCSVIFSYLYQLSFINTLDFSYLTRRSTCDYCSRRLKFIELLPIVSFVILKGRSSCCKQRLSWCYVGGETIAMLPIVLIYYQFIAVSATFFLTFFLFLLTLSLQDIRSRLIDVYTLIVFFNVLILLCQLYVATFIYTLIISHLIFIVFRRYIGYGDVLIICLISLFVPVTFLWYLLFITCFVASFITLIMNLFKQLKTIPLIPYIFVSFCIVSLSYPDINYYLGGFLF